MHEVFLKGRTTNDPPPRRYVSVVFVIVVSLNKYDLMCFWCNVCLVSLLANCELENVSYLLCESCFFNRSF